MSSVIAPRRVRGVIVALVAVVLGTLAAPARAAGTFTDDDASPHQADIEAIAALGITVGCAPGKFCPTVPVTREQMATFLVRAFGIASSAVDAFTDDEGSPHEADINAIAAAGITVGCAPGKFCPTVPVTREQMATFLVRARGLVPFTTPVFTDVASGHLPDVNALAGHLITVGCGGGRFCPTDPVLREQMATFLVRALALSSQRAPVVTITSPADLATVPTAYSAALGRYAASVELVATATDVNGGTPTFTWTSSVDGSLGAGTPRTALLTIPSGDASQPTIVARATDADGLFSLDSIQLKLFVPSPIS